MRWPTHAAPQVKTEASEAPLSAICLAALRLRHEQQEAERRAHAGRGTDTGLIFTTRYRTQIQPRNFIRSFDLRIRKAGARRITVHGTRRRAARSWPPLTLTRASQCSRSSGTV